MGPAIILDKSAVQAIGDNALRVQSEFFYTVITPILIWEICGDIQKAREGKCTLQQVQTLARRAHPLNSIANADWRLLCLGEFSGHRFPMLPPDGRRPIVAGSHRVPLSDGKYASILDHQPESEVLLRWEHGGWRPSDEKLAAKWRAVSRGLDLERLRRRFGPVPKQIETPDQIKSIVDRVLEDPSLQFSLLTLLAEECATSQSMRLGLLHSFRTLSRTNWQQHCPFARHCVRTLLTFYVSLQSGFVTPRSTNKIDIEYFFYTPFAPIFVSGDQGTHARLAPLLLAEDQAFVPLVEFRYALNHHACRVAAIKAADTPIHPDALEPAEDSLIQKLWIDAWGYFRKPPSQRQIRTRSETDPSIKKMFDTLKSEVDARPEQYPKRKPWPSW